MFPSVTTILSPFSGIEELKKRFPQLIATAAYRGSLVHNYCESISLGFSPLFMEEEAQPYVESFKRWFDNVQDVKFVETRLMDSRIGYHGQFDIICRIKGDLSYSLWDYKTPQAGHKTWKPQTAAYRHLAELHDIEIGRHGIIRLRKSGNSPIIDEHTNTYNRDWQIFISCLNVYNNFY